MPPSVFAQKLHAMAQPICDETHAVTRLERSVPWRITTVSTSQPSRRRITSLVVKPSNESWRD